MITIPCLFFLPHLFVSYTSMSKTLRRVVFWCVVLFSLHTCGSSLVRKLKQKGKTWVRKDSFATLVKTPQIKLYLVDTPKMCTHADSVAQHSMLDPSFPRSSLFGFTDIFSVL